MLNHDDWTGYEGEIASQVEEVEWDAMTAEQCEEWLEEQEREVARLAVDHCREVAAAWRQKRLLGRAGHVNPKTLKDFSREDTKLARFIVYQLERGRRN